MLEKLKEKKLLVASSISAGILSLTNFAFAAEGSATEVSTALQAVATDIKGVFTSVAPVALGIAGTFLVWRYGMKFFKAISK